MEHTMTERRVTRLEQRLGGQDLDTGGPLLMVNVRAWPVEDQDAYRHGTADERGDLTEAHTGRRPPPAGPRGAIRCIVDMAPDPLHPARDLTEVW
jgi:hypothetical protein